MLAPEDREIILSASFPRPLIVLDELHKHQRYKALLKGLFDKHRETLKILLTGSSRQDSYQKSRDSLAGRYYLHQLHPLTLGELAGRQISLPDLTNFNPFPSASAVLEELLHFGGFPSRSLLFQRQLGVPALQLVRAGGIFKKNAMLTVASSDAWLGYLP